MTKHRPFAASAHAVLIAPGAPRGDLRLGYGAGILGVLIGAVAGLAHGGGPLLVTVLALRGFDRFGGAVVNAMTSGSARFHGNAGSRKRRLLFVALHAHILVLALITPGLSWFVAATLYTIQLVAAAVIEVVPQRHRRAVAFACASVVATTAVTFVSVPAVVAWVVPVLCIKLLLGHLVPARGVVGGGTAAQDPEHVQAAR